MPYAKRTNRRNLTPPEVAERLGVAPEKVVAWIRKGELRAINVANRGCVRPRYSISPEALEDFENSRLVVPDGGLSTTQRLRRTSVAPSGKDHFPDL